MRTWMSGLVLAVFLGVTLGYSTEANAGAKIIFYQTGEDLFEAGPLPAPYDAKFPGVKAGYKCSIFGIFWAYMHIWNCEPVAFRGDTYDRNPEIVGVIKAKYKEGDMKVGAWKKHGRWLFVGIILVLIIGAVMRKKGKEAEG